MGSKSGGKGRTARKADGASPSAAAPRPLALRRAALPLLALLLAAGGGAIWLARGRVARDPGLSVLLVSIDTLRADHLRAYGYARGRTPALDALARDGVVFEDVYSHCPLTLPAHASLLTGLLPPRHGVRDNEGFSLAGEHRTLATRFRAAGLATGAAVSAYVLRRATGIGEGFELYDDALPVDDAVAALGLQQRDGALATTALDAWLAGLGERRFFAFLHLYEPHTPYAPPERYRNLDPYDGEIAYADELVGRIVAGLLRRGQLERTLLAVTSDHGEALGEHGELEHGFFLYRETLRVPLLLRLPGRASAARRVRGIAAQADVAATLLDLAGLPAEGLDGRSLRGAIASGRAVAAPVYSETLLPRYHFGWSELHAVTEERYRFIRAPRPELYDLGADPGETQDVSGQRPEAVARMAVWLERMGKDALPEREAVPREVRERLKALGYLGGGGAARADGPLADPKDKIEVYEAFRRAAGMSAHGDDEQAARALRAVLARDPGIVDGWEALGTTLFRLGRPQQAAAALARGIEQDPSRPGLHLALARVEEAAGRLDRAESHARLAAVREPAEAYEILAELALRRGRDAEARDCAHKSLSADPQGVLGHFVLATLARRAGHCEEALAEYRAAQQARRLRQHLIVPGIHAGAGDCLARLGREIEAEAEFRDEIAMVPYSREGRLSLAALYRSQGRDAEAREALEGVVTANSSAGPDEYDAVVRGFGVLGDAEAARAWSARAASRFPADPRFR